MPDIFKAVQYMNDLQDFALETFSNALDFGDDPTSLRAFIEGGRMASFMANIEHSIAGPFYFGDEPSYVDYYLLGKFDWEIDSVCLTPLTAKLAEKGFDLYAKAPKIRKILDALRSTPAYSTEHPYPLTLPTFGPRRTMVSPALVAAY